MERVPIRLGSLRTTVKSIRREAAPSLLPAGPSVSNASLVRVCRVCTTHEARYTCPRCNTPYCSVDCYRAHGESCTEHFYEDHVRSEMQMTSSARGDDDKKQEKRMQELLQRVGKFHEEQQQHLMDANEDEETLVERMQELALLDQSGDLTLKCLTLEERKRFLGEVADGRLGRFVKLWSPWWLLSERKYRSETSVRRQQLILVELGEDVDKEEDSWTVGSTRLYPIGLFTNRDAQNMPQDISALLPGGRQPSPCLRYHLLEVLFAYAVVLRVFNGDYGQDVAEAALLLLDLCQVLRVDARYDSVEHVCVACLEKQSSGEPAANILAMQDTQQLLRSDVFLLDALSDTRTMVERYTEELERSGESDKKARKEKKRAIKQLAGVGKKLQFYRTWVYLMPMNEFLALATEIHAFMKNRQLLA